MKPALMILLSFFLLSNIGLQAQTLTWKVFGKLNYSRNCHEAMALDDHRIIVMGGFINGVPTKTTEIIDITTGKITIGPQMNYAHAWFRVLRAPDSSIIAIAGNYESGRSGTAIEMLDRQTMTWTTIGNLPTHTAQLEACWINDQEFVVVGGVQNDQATINTCQVFNIATKHGRTLAEAPHNLNSHVLAKSSRGDLLLFAGRYGGAGSVKNPDIHKYDIATNKWIKVDNISELIAKPTYLSLPGGNIIYMGGEKNELEIDPTPKVFIENNGEFVQLGNLPFPAYWNSATPYNSSNIIVQGGMNHDNDYILSAAFINFQTNTITAAPSTIYPHSFHQLAALPSRKNIGNNAIFAIAGKSNYAGDGIVEILDLFSPEISFSSVEKNCDSTVFSIFCDTAIVSIAQVSTSPEAKLILSNSLPAKQVTLTVVPKNPGDVGTFQIRAVNKAGKDTVLNGSFVGSQLQATTSTLDFGEVPIDTDTCRTIEIKNTSNRMVVLESPTLASNIGFSISGSFPKIFLPNETKSITICFHGYDENEYTNLLTLVDNCISTTIKISAKPVSLYIPVYTQIQSNCDTTIFNVSSGDTIVSISPITANPQISVDISPALPAKQCNITVSPVLTGSSGTYSIKISTKKGYETIIDGTLEGRKLAIESPTALVIDMDTCIITRELCKSVTVRNVSNQPVDLTEATLAIGREFKVQPGQLPITLAPNATATINVCFVTDQKGEFRDTLRIDNGCFPIDVAVHGVTIYPDVPIVAHLKKICDSTFFDVACSSNIVSIVPLTTQPEFTYTVSPQLPTERIIITVTPTDPTKGGTYSFRVSSAYGKDTIIQSEFVGKTLEVAEPSGLVLDFGDVFLGVDSCSYVKIKNIYTEPISISNPAFLGNYNFTIPAGQLPITINPNETKSLAVCCNPKAVGACQDTLRFVNNCLAYDIITKANVQDARPPVLTGAAQDCWQMVLTIEDDFGISQVHALEQSNIEYQLSGLNSRSVRISIALKDQSASGSARFEAKSISGKTLTTDLIEISPAKIIFADMDADSVVYIDSTMNGLRNCSQIKMRNPSAIAITIPHVAFFRNAEFSVPLGQLPMTINPGEEKSLTVCFSPSAFGPDRDTLFVQTSCGNSAFTCVSKGDTTHYAADPTCGHLPYSINQKSYGKKRPTVYNPYPNPAGGNVSIKYIYTGSDRPIVTVTDVFGTATEAKVLSCGAEELTIGTDGLRSGVYELRISLGGETFAFPLTVVR